MAVCGNIPVAAGLSSSSALVVATAESALALNPGDAWAVHALAHGLYESARRAGIQGTTLLRIFIERDGRVSDVTVQRSAGDQSLDQAASDAVRRWRFEPAVNSAGPVAMWAVVPVEFRISDRD